MRRFRILCFLVFAAAFFAPEAHAQKKNLTFIKDVGPVIKKYCLPCHLEENENPSGLAMDNYELLMKGGNHGNTVIPGKPKTSNLYLKLLPDPPFGKQMARNRRKLLDEEVRIIYEWIEQGAKKD
ncbi:MAG: c-type cytochrome domain-containing protein [Bacteroidota bacterium]